MSYRVAQSRVYKKRNLMFFSFFRFSWFQLMKVSLRISWKGHQGDHVVIEDPLKGTLTLP